MKALSSPRFSVVIPCYNEESYIGDTLTSLRRQTFDGSFEIIVVDNNSTDKSQAIAKQFGVKVITESKAGVCWARQAGTEVARGEIVISSDADTIFAPDWLQKIDATFKRNKKYVAVAGPCIYRSGPYWGKVYPQLLFGAVNGYTRLLGQPFYATATNIAFKRSVWSGYDVNAPQGGDELGLLRQLKKQGRVAFVNNNPVYTSARRLKRGFFYNVFVTFIFYYLLGYYLDRILKRTVIGSAPAYRFNNDEETGGMKNRLKNMVSSLANKTDG